MATVYYVHVVPSAKCAVDTIQDMSELPRFNCDTIWDDMNDLVEEKTRINMRMYSKLISKQDYEYMIFETRDLMVARNVCSALSEAILQGCTLKSSFIQGRN